MNPLEQLLDRAALRRMAGARSFARGEEYFARGQVRTIAEHDGTIAAKVLGTREYRVKLWMEGAGIDYSCTCPVGADGEFCKHCVAVGLAWLDRGHSRGSKPKTAKPAITMDDVRSYLAGQDTEALVGMLMEQAMEDDRLRQRLLMKAARKGPKGLDLATYRNAIDSAVNAGEFVEYREMYDYARGIGEAIDAVEELLKEGHPAAAIELAEHALAAIEEAMGSADDSDGHMGGILERLQELHLKACRKARPDAMALAKRLFEWELRTEWNTFFGTAQRYANVLGEKGLEVYRTLAQAEWERVPEVSPGRSDPDRYGKRFRITQIMETLARQSGDAEAVVAIKKRDLSTAWAYLQIAETYKQARKHDLALEWAERGLKAYPERTDSRLRLFLAEEYHRRKRHDEAMAQVWVEFTESPGLQQYQNLKGHADRTKSWPAWREKALAALRERVAKAKADAGKSRWGGSAHYSELVSIFLWEKDIETAWQEAKTGECSPGQWLDLAAGREKEHPEDVLPVYQGQVDPTLGRKHKEAYREAIGLLRKVRGLMIRLGREAAFAPYLESVRAAHKPKRNFMKLLERAKWE